jgi:hypothetical protein
MSLWQEVLQTLAVLGWWRIVIILIATILVGTLGATCIVYLVLRFILKDPIRYIDTFGLLSIRIKKPANNPGGDLTREGTSLPNFPVFHPPNNIRNIIPQQNTTITAIYSDTTADIDSSNPAPGIPSVTTQPTDTSDVESNSLATDLIVELDYNLRIINEFDGRKLLPLQNRAWLAHLFSNNKFPIDLEHQLEQVYIDISLWNNMLWISTELSHQTDFSNQRYQESLFNISERLKKIRQIIK